MLYPLSYEGGVSAVACTKPQSTRCPLFWGSSLSGA